MTLIITQFTLNSYYFTISGLLMLMNADEAPDTTSSMALIGGFSNNTGTGASYIDIM